MAPDSTSMIPSAKLRWAGFALVAISTFAIEMASLAPSEHPRSGLLTATLLVLFAAALMRFAPVPQKKLKLPKFLTTVLIGLGLLPFVIEPFREELLRSDGRPLEIQFFNCLRNVSLGLVILGTWAICLRMACLISLFLTLFAVLTADHWYVLPFLALYGVAGVVYLCITYWHHLKQVEGTLDHADANSLPWGVISASALLIGLAISVAAIGPDRVLGKLGEWLPFSGGTSDYDQRARRGVGDGDESAQGKNAQSTGPVETDQFLESPFPSLYDVVNEKYGNVQKHKKREQQRAIALPSSVVRELPKHPADSNRPSRDFGMVRTKPRKQLDLKTESARALLEVQGPTPLHIRAAAYDIYDGQRWQEARVQNNTLLPEKEETSNWMRLRNQPLSTDYLIDHKIKIGLLDGSLVPTPPQICRFRVGKVDQADFFSWSQDRILRMADGGKLPGGTVVQTESFALDVHHTEAIHKETAQMMGSANHLVVLEGQEKLAQLVQQWTQDLPEGWPQIQAIIDHLRTDYVLDAEAGVPTDTPDAIEHFLLESKRGPDYLFASSAAILLRHLGYPTRLVNGFYASPEKYDRATGHTPVTTSDLHFWPEILLNKQGWIVLEPTPGYTILSPQLPWHQQLWQMLVGIGQWCLRHWIMLALGLLTLTWLWTSRRPIQDRFAVWYYNWRPSATWQEQVLRCLGIVERRGAWNGLARPVGISALRWWSQQVSPQDPASLLDLAHLVDWALYGPETPPCAKERITEICQSCLQEWNRHRFAQPKQTNPESMMGVAA